LDLTRGEGKQCRDLEEGEGEEIEAHLDLTRGDGKEAESRPGKGAELRDG
jgi:hypothetical protein